MIDAALTTKTHDVQYVWINLKTVPSLKETILFRLVTVTTTAKKTCSGSVDPAIIGRVLGYKAYENWMAVPFMCNAVWVTCSLCSRWMYTIDWCVQANSSQTSEERRVTFHSRNTINGLLTRTHTLLQSTAVHMWISYSSLAAILQARLCRRFWRKFRTRCLPGNPFWWSI